MVYQILYEIVEITKTVVGEIKYSKISEKCIAMNMVRLQMNLKGVQEDCFFGFGLNLGDFGGF